MLSRLDLDRPVLVKEKFLCLLADADEHKEIGKFRANSHRAIPLQRNEVKKSSEQSVLT